MNRQLQIHKLTFRYDAADENLLESVNLRLDEGWTGFVGANGAGKSTLLKLAVGDLQPIEGEVRVSGEAIYCEQRTDELPSLLPELLTSTEPEARRLVGKLGLHGDWCERWDSLSHGERKRAQISVALWQMPEVLAIDEPTNHLDISARGMLLTALEEYQGVGLIVSHDRELLDQLCRACVFVDPPAAELRKGNYSEAAARARGEQDSALRARQEAKQELSRLNATTDKRRDKAAAAQRQRYKGKNLGWKDSDARHKAMVARVSGKDGRAGKLLRQMQGRVEQAEAHLAGVKTKKEYSLGIWLSGGKSQRNFLVNQPAGVLPLGDAKQLVFPELVVRPDERVALTGPNGTGKSTLLRSLVESLEVPRERFIYVPQEIPLAESRRVLHECLELADEELGRLMTTVSRLGSRPQRLLDSTTPSPGEVRKLVLSLGIIRTPHLIIMDEPTNHMDLPSIECLEEALAGCPCGLILVSHDHRFLRELTTTRWDITPQCRLSKTSW